MIEYREIGWWYWLGMVGLLWAGLNEWPLGFVLTIVLGTIQVFHFTWRELNPTAFSVQVRIAYLGFLLLGQWEPMYELYWLLFLGTTVRVLSGYCLLARTLSLLPWNRTAPLTIPLIRQTFLTFKSGISCRTSCLQISKMNVHQAV